ncbi:1-deoxy-D-xylulose-5-phosphate synthase [Brachybacterium muris]|uniref:1-deoxy-D-xylulose-5-phosphate synthase n=1 Tax=Brachybacterium muris TaxID=219301 RepID=UPI00223C1C11|nr:1-deoxy-D-xylulose-5-phosphate synthase [Brachybacterium muris]MCT2262369.1 1-deoxy-D-xylulose-5-phosphate synthase [Brachybacterium muris]
MPTTQEHPAVHADTTEILEPAGSAVAESLLEDIDATQDPAEPGQADVAIPGDPAALRALAPAELPALSRTLRRRLLEITSSTGGHLGPNLGVVELTIALHREFDSPREAIVFDTGHQAYVHKMLTGRADLEGLRSAGGVSGYPDRGESAHDVVENSHASGSIAWAHGIDRAHRLAGEPGCAVAVIGDGALTGGVGLEALNELAADIGSGTVVVLNDNTRSYAPTIGGLARHLQDLRDGTTTPGEDLFTAIGLTYLGPIDGHDHAALADALARAREAAEDPARSGVVVHVVTRKGAGYARAEADVMDHWHATGPFEIEPPTVAEVYPPADAPAPATTWTARFGETILEAARADDRVVALSAAMVDPVGLTPMQRELPARVLDLGIAEQLAMDTAAGLAQGGAKPVLALYSTFLNRAFDQLLLDVALHEEDVTITLDRAGVTGDDGPSHHGIWDLAVAAQVPGLSLWAPRDGDRLSEALPAALSTHGPSLVRFPKGACPEGLPAIDRVPAGDVLAGDPSAPIDVLVVTIGALAHRAVEAAQRVMGVVPGAAAEGVAPNVVVLDPVQALPLPEALLDLAGAASAVVTLEDGVAERGIGAALAVRLAQRASRTSPMPPLRTLGVVQKFIPHAKRDAILSDNGLDAAGIEESIRSLLG